MECPVRVLILSYFYPPEFGAPALRLRAITEAFVRRGWSVEVLTGMPQYPLGRVFPAYRGHLARREIFGGARVHRVPTYATQRLGVHRVASYALHALGCLAVGGVRRSRWDVVFVESPPLLVGLPGLWLARRSGARLALDVTDLWPDSARELGLVRSRWLLRWAGRLEGLLYRRAWRISCATGGILSVLCNDKGVPPDKLDLLPNGADPALFAPRDPEGRWDGGPAHDGSKPFIYTGLHGHAQGLSVLLESARLLRDTPDVNFILMGDGPAKTELVAAAERDRLDGVRFLPSAPVEEAARVLAASYASVVPLLKRPLLEGAVPSKIITSLAAGVPVVFAGRGEAARLLTTHACGVVAEPENAVDLVRAIRWLAEHPGERDRLARNGLRLVEREYRWEAITDRWLERWDLPSLGSQSGMTAGTRSPRATAQN
jgi:colanic acid biosynthesis glycosyl transferase WcaI